MLRLVASLTAAVLVTMAVFGDIQPDGYAEDPVVGPSDPVIGRLAASDGSIILTAEEIDRIALLATQNRDQTADIVPLSDGSSRAARMTVDNIQQVALRADPVPNPVSGGLADFAPGHAVSGSGVNMRAGPGTAYATLRRLAIGTPVQIVSRNVGGWAELRLSDGTVGFMSSSYLAMR